MGHGCEGRTPLGTRGVLQARKGVASVPSMRPIKAVVKRNYSSKMALILAPAISIPNHEPVPIFQMAASEGRNRLNTVPE
jgi:hypothetical protein